MRCVTLQRGFKARHTLRNVLTLFSSYLGFGLTVIDSFHALYLMLI